MTIRRTLSIGSVALLLAAVMTACFPTFPAPPGGDNGGGGGEASTIAGTTWAGTDSDGDSWEIEFQSDNTLGISYNGDSSDIPDDVWSSNGSTLSLTVTGFTEGDVTFTGTYSGGNSLTLDGNYVGRSFTLPLTEK